MKSRFSGFSKVQVPDFWFLWECPARVPLGSRFSGFSRVLVPGFPVFVGFVIVIYVV